MIEPSFFKASAFLWPIPKRDLEVQKDILLGRQAHVDRHLDYTSADAAEDGVLEFLTAGTDKLRPIHHRGKLKAAALALSMSPTLAASALTSPGSLTVRRKNSAEAC
jgi:hypothetical protein